MKETYTIEEIVRAFISLTVWANVQSELEKMPEYKELIKMLNGLGEKLKQSR